MSPRLFLRQKQYSIFDAYLVITHFCLRTDHWHTSPSSIGVIMERIVRPSIALLKDILRSPCGSEWRHQDNFSYQEMFLLRELLAMILNIVVRLRTPVINLWFAETWRLLPQRRLVEEGGNCPSEDQVVRGVLPTEAVMIAFRGESFMGLLELHGMVHNYYVDGWTGVPAPEHVLWLSRALVIARAWRLVETRRLDYAEFLPGYVGVRAIGI